MQRVKPFSICDSCARFKTRDNIDHFPDGPWPLTTFIAYCDAFPNKIPIGIEFGGYDHRSPYPDDGGIRFELAPGKELTLSSYEKNVPVDQRLRKPDPSRDQEVYGHYWPTEADLAGTCKYFVVIHNSPDAPSVSQAINDPVGVIKRDYYADGSRVDQLIKDSSGWSDTQLLKDYGQDNGPDYLYFQVYEDRLKVVLEQIGNRPADASLGD